MEKFKMKNYGFITDAKTYENKTRLKSYSTWLAMINRCYNKHHYNFKHYGGKGVSICKEWKLFSNFKKWFNENYIEGYCLDKDIKQKYTENKVYSPKTCCFVSRYENTKEGNSRKDYSFIKKGILSNYKPKEFYTSNPKLRYDFKRICRKKGWIFEDFEETCAGKDKRGEFIYTYKYIGID